MYEIEFITTDTQIVLKTVYGEASQSGVTYSAIRMAAPHSRLIIDQIDIVNRALIRENELKDWETLAYVESPPTTVDITRYDGTITTLKTLPQVIGEIDAAVALGQVGPTGPAGATGPTGSGLDWEGPWLISTPYVLRDSVERLGSSYVCILAHTSAATSEPGNGATWETYWDLMAQKGDTGAAGPAGGSVSSVFSRVGAVVQVAGDYSANQITNTSGVAGAFVQTALDTLDAGKSGTAHSHIFANLTDVKLGAPIEAHALMYDAGNSDWRNRALVKGDVTSLQSDLTGLQDQIDGIGDVVTEIGDLSNVLDNGPYNYLFDEATNHLNMALTVGDTQVTRNADGFNMWCRSIWETNADKWYMEYYVTQITGSPTFLVGMKDVGNYPVTSSSGTLQSSYMVDGTGVVWEDGSPGSDLFTDVVVTDTIMVAVDATLGRIWFGKNGTWDGDPAAGTGPAIIWTPQVDEMLAPYVYITSNTDRFQMFLAQGNGFTVPTNFTFVPDWQFVLDKQTLHFNSTDERWTSRATQIADVTGLQSALDGKIGSGSPLSGDVNFNDWAALNLKRIEMPGNVSDVLDISNASIMNIGAASDMNFYIDTGDAHTTKSFKWFKDASGVSLGVELLELREDGALNFPVTGSIINLQTIELLSDTVVALISTDHALTVGEYAADNLAIGAGSIGNIIQSRTNGLAHPLQFNPVGGDITMGSFGSTDDVFIYQYTHCVDGLVISTVFQDGLLLADAKMTMQSTVGHEVEFGYDFSPSTFETIFDLDVPTIDWEITGLSGALNVVDGTIEIGGVEIYHPGNEPSGTPDALPLAGGTMSGDINMGSNDLTFVNKLTLKNNEYTAFTGDGDFGYDASRGLYLYHTQVPGQETGAGVYTILDTANITGGANIGITGTTVDITDGTPITFNLAIDANIDMLDFSLTNVNEITLNDAPTLFSLSIGDSLAFHDDDDTIRFAGLNPLVLPGSLSMTGDINMFDNDVLGFGLLEFSNTPTISLVSRNTSDGADTGVITISASDAVGIGRSGRIAVYGEDHASTPGLVEILSGNSGDIAFNTQGSNDILLTTSTGDIALNCAFGGEIDLFSPVDFNTNTLSNVGAITMVANADLNFTGASGDITGLQKLNCLAVTKKDKISVWTGANYSIGMITGLNFGYIGSDTINSGATDYCMTFQMNSAAVLRGFHWGTVDDTVNTGGMSLTTGGKLFVNDRILVGAATGPLLTSTGLDLQGGILADIDVDGGLRFDAQAVNTAIADDDLLGFFDSSDPDNPLKFANQDAVAVWIAAAAAPPGRRMVAKFAEGIRIGAVDTETSFGSYTIPADLLGTEGVIIVSLSCQITTNVAGTFLLRIKLGGTTLFADVTAALGVGAVQAMTLNFQIGAAGSTSVQRGGGEMTLSAGDGASPGVAGFQQAPYMAGPFTLAAGTEDSTTALTLDITGQFSWAAGSQLFVQHGTFEFLPGL